MIEDPPVDCLHRLEARGTIECSYCGMRGQEAQLWGCSVYGLCTVGKRHANVRACIVCERREEPAECLTPSS
jgi:hypothetical protein